MKNVCGSHNFCERFGKIIIKSYMPKTQLDQKYFMYLCQNNPKKNIQKYYQELINSSIPVAKVYNISYSECKTLIIKQQFIDGNTLKETIDLLTKKLFACNDFNLLDLILKYIHKLIQLQKKVNDFNSNIKIDLNTNNFIVNNNEIVLVDITPPLYKNLLQKKMEWPITILFESIYSISGQWITMLGYLFRPFIYYGYVFKRSYLEKIIRYILSKIINSVREIWGDSYAILLNKKVKKITNVTKNPFECKIALINMFLNKDINSIQLYNMYKNIKMSEIFKNYEEKFMENNFRESFYDLIKNYKKKSIYMNFCNIGFKLNIDIKYYDIIKSDLKCYINNDDSDYGIIYNIDFNVNDNIYNELCKYILNKEANLVKIYESNKGVKTYVKKYAFNNINIFHVYEFNCIVIDDKKHKYIVLSENAIDKERQLLRIIKEISLRNHESNGSVLFHAAGLIINNKGVVITGPKGAGKTTLLCMLLSEDNVQYIANDKMIVSDKLKMVYLPLALQAGIGTVDNNECLKKYIKNNKLIRPQNSLEEKDNFKYQITSLEVSRIFNCELRASCDISVIIIPHICIDSDKIEILSLSKEEKKKYLIDSILSPNDSMWPNAWVEPLTIDKKAIEKNAYKIIEKLINDTYIIKMNYGTKITNGELRKIIENHIKQLKKS